jgi:hypothetical protein
MTVFTGTRAQLRNRGTRSQKRPGNGMNSCSVSAADHDERAKTSALLCSAGVGCGLGGQTLRGARC